MASPRLLAVLGLGLTLGRALPRPGCAPAPPQPSQPTSGAPVAEGQIPTVAGAGNRTGVPAGGVGPAALASRRARLVEASAAYLDLLARSGATFPNAAYLDLLVRNSRLVPNAAYLELLVARPSEASAAHLDLLVRDGRKEARARAGPPLGLARGLARYGLTGEEAAALGLAAEDRCWRARLGDAAATQADESAPGWEVLPASTALRPVSFELREHAGGRTLARADPPAPIVRSLRALRLGVGAR